VGETRAIAVTRMTTGEHLFAADVGDVKVRDLRWIGENRVLVVTSQTRGIAMLGVPRSELFFGQVLDLEKKKLVQVLDRTPDVLAVLYGSASIRTTQDGEALFVRGVNVTTDQIDLHRIDLRTGRGRSVAAMDRETDDYVLDGDGEVIAMARYVERTGRWSLRLPNKGRGFRPGRPTPRWTPPPSTAWAARPARLSSAPTGGTWPSRKRIPRLRTSCSKSMWTPANGPAFRSNTIPTCWCIIRRPVC